MKISKQVINEVLNGSNVWIKQQSVAPTDCDFMYYLSLYTRPNPTKLIIFINGDRARYAVTLGGKVNLETVVGSAMAATRNSDEIIKNLEDIYMEGLDTLMSKYGYLGTTTQTLVKKYGVLKAKKDSGWISLEKLYMYLIKEGVLNTTITRHIPALSNIQVEEATFQHGNIAIVGYSESNPSHKNILKVMDDAEKRLKKVGLDSVYYGKFFLVPKSQSGKQRTMADYVERDDTTRIFDLAQKASGYDPVDTVVHELGHRYYYKKMSRAGRQTINDKYSEIMSDYNRKKRKEEDEVKKDQKFKQGDRIQSAAYGELEYGGYGPKSLNGRKYYHKFYIIVNDKKTERFYGWERLADAVKHLNKMQTSVRQVRTGDPWLPSEYSKTSSTEWFAEIFSFAVADNNKEILDWIKALK